MKRVFSGFSPHAAAAVAANDNNNDAVDVGSVLSFPPGGT